jgi:thioredoxin reductase (NADPH)
MVISEKNIVIIGAGPAGLSLSASLKIAGIEHIILEKSNFPGGQAGMINNGLDDFIIGNISNGKMLVSRFQEFILQHELPIFYNCEMLRLDYKSKKIIINNEGVFEEIIYKVLVIATGCRLKIDNTFSGKGFDEHIYYRISKFLTELSGKFVSVIGSGDNALMAALKITGVSHKVYIINRSSTWKARKDLVDKIKDHNKIEIFTGYQIKSLILVNSEGEKLESIVISDGENEVTLKTDKLVYKIGYIPNTEFLPGQILMNETGYLLCDENFESSAENIFAIGDVLSNSLKRISVAIAHGTQLGNILINSHA